MERKKGLAFFLMISMLTLSGCADRNVPETASETGTEAVSETALEEESRAEENPYLGKGTVGGAWYASTIAGAVGKDTEVSLKDDYFTAVNQEYLTGLTIEDGHASAGVFADADRIMIQRTLELLQEKNPKSHDGELVSSLYDLATDWEGRNKEGIEPIRANVERIRSLS